MHIQRFTCLTRVSLFALLVFICASPAFGRGAASGYCQQGGQTIQVLGYVSSTATPVQASYTGTGCNVLVLYSNGGGTTATGPSGVVNTSGTAVTWLAGNVFNANGQWSGLAITIASVSYTISSCSSATACTLTSSAGTQTSIAYSMSAATPAAIFSDNAGTPKSNPFSVSATGYWFYYADNGSYANQYSGTAILSTFTNAALPLSDPSNLPNAVRWNATLGTTFQQQCAAAAAAPNTALIVDTVAPVATGFTAVCPIIFYPGGFIQPANGQTVAFSVLSAGLTQICDASPGGICAILGVPAYYPQWWGAKGDGSNDTAAIASAVGAACTAGSATVVFPSGYTFEITAAVKANSIIGLCSGLAVDIEGVIQVAASSGSYYSIFGPSSGSLSNVRMFGHGIVDQNAANNPLVSSGDLSTYPRTIFRTGADGSGTNNTVQDIAIKNWENLWGIYLGSANSSVTNVRALNGGGGSIDTDASFFYCANGANGCTLTGNTISCPSPNTAMCSTAFETHASDAIVSNNSSTNLRTGGNAVGDNNYITTGVSWTGNVITGALNGIDIWSVNCKTYSSPCSGSAPTFGLNGVVILNNTVTINQLSYAGSYPGNGAAVVPTTNNLPIENLKVSGNQVVYDLSTGAGDAYNAQTYAYGYQDVTASQVAGITNGDFSANVAVNCPAYCDFYDGQGANINFDNEQIVNPGSTLNPALAASGRAGIVIENTTGTIGGYISVKGGSVTDNLGTCRFGYGLLLATLNTSGIVVDGLNVSARDGTCTSLQAAIDANTNTQLPYLRATVNVPTAKTLPGAVVQGGSTVYSMGLSALYTYKAPNTSGWSTVTYHPSAPSPSSGCGTTPTITGTDRGGTIILGASPSGTCTLTFATAFTVSPQLTGGTVVNSNHTGGVQLISWSTTTTTVFFSISGLAASDPVTWSFPNAN